MPDLARLAVHGRYLKIILDSWISPLKQLHELGYWILIPRGFPYWRVIETKYSD